MAKKALLHATEAVDNSHGLFVRSGGTQSL
jgi:hypothetical protein